MKTYSPWFLRTLSGVGAGYLSTKPHYPTPPLSDFLKPRSHGAVPLTAQSRCPSREDFLPFWKPLRVAFLETPQKKGSVLRPLTVKSREYLAQQ